MQAKTEFDLFLDRIRPYLLQYLESKGLNTKTAIPCLNPAHKDSTPSMLCRQAEEKDWRAYCLSCGARADIFDAYSVLEGTPRKGPDWFTKTVLPLASKYKITVPDRQLSTQETFRYSLYKLYEDVTSLINHDVDLMKGFPREYILERKWTSETLSTLDIGTLDFSLLDKFVSSSDQKKFGLYRPDVFNSKNIIFPVRDNLGRVIRFFARQNEKPKFTSTTSADLTVDVWRGHGHLYLSNLISKYSTSALLVEGQSDVVTLYQARVPNVIGLCGCRTFSEDHSDALAMQGITKLTICYDGDTHGQEAAKHLLQQPFVTEGSLSYSILSMPDESDPDLYVRTNGKDTFQTLLDECTISSFEFLLSQQDVTQSSEELCNKLIPHIAKIKSDVSQEIMARDLSHFLNGEISIGAILADVQRLDSAVVSEALEKKKAVVSATTRQASINPGQARDIYRDAISKIDEIDKGHSSQKYKTTGLSRLNACKAMEEQGGTGGYALKPEGLGAVSDLLEGGDWKGKKLIIVGGAPNVGKSTFIDNFIWEIISNPSNDAIAYLLTIDDPAEARYRRIGCCAVGDKDFDQNMVADPKFHSQYHAGVYEKREYAYSCLAEAIAQGRLIIEDDRDGTTLSHCEKRLIQIRRENPDKNIVFGIDNFHDTTDWESLPDVARVKQGIKYGKRICGQQNALGLFSAEYKKLETNQRSGTDGDLADSRSMMYVPHLTIHLYTDYDGNSQRLEEATLVHPYKGEMYPRVVASVGKNKITSRKGKNVMAFNLYPAAALFRRVSIEQAIDEAKERYQAKGVQ